MMEKEGKRSGKPTRQVFKAIFFGCLWLLSLAMSSCGSRRVAGDIAISEETRRNIREIVEDILERRTVEVRTSDLKGDIIITRREFDTSGEKDPSTGEYPTSSITDTRINISGRDTVIGVDTVSVKGDRDVVIEDDADTRIRDKTEVERKESSWPRAVMYICGTLCVFVVVYLLRRFKVI